MRISVSVIGSVALFASGCFASSFVPKPSLEIQVTTSWSGSETFWRIGKKIQSGYWSKEIFETLKGVPAARKHIETWRGRRILSFILSVFSSVITAVGLFTISPGAGFDAQNTLSLTMLAGGAFPVSIASLLYGLSADSHLWDAINLYNQKVREEAGQQKQKQAGLRLVPGGLAVRW